MSEPFLTARELAELLGFTSETILRWTRQGLIPYYRMPGTVKGRLRYRLSEVEASLMAHATGSGFGRSAPSGQRTRRERQYGVPATPPDRPRATGKG